ncbi:4844_t:CDS:2 [Funneliformis caledonium]|uniref:4844_t:CDS:1 n=1 Tax=Funneliformis caledonium TaxID=1117310 RepID=A0A9N9BGX7_9GLOM|nr:4844_t:CDS:2 [Funneliformis caledonium]
MKDFVRSSAANVSYQSPSQERVTDNTEVDKLKKVKNQLQTELKVKSTSKITIELLDEGSASEARKNLFKGQIPAEYRLDYNKMFSEQSKTIYEKLIPEIMNRHINPSVTQLSDWLRSMHEHKKRPITKM